MRSFEVALCSVVRNECKIKQTQDEFLYLSLRPVATLSKRGGMLRKQPMTATKKYEKRWLVAWGANHLLRLFEDLLADISQNCLLNEKIASYVSSDVILLRNARNKNGHIDSFSP